jgi:acyl-CoA synthetase (AMP-forming)/AMP-acid ligase II
MVIFGCVIAGLIYSIISNYRAQYADNVITTESGKEVDITLDSIKKDIALFQRLEASSPTKITSYNDIKNKIALLEKTGQSPLDIQALKKVLQEEYFK